MPGLFEPQVKETCPCGAMWLGPHGSTQGKTERADWRASHDQCRHGAAKALGEGLQPIAEGLDIEKIQNEEAERIGRALQESEVVDLLCDLLHCDEAPAEAALANVVGLLNLGPTPEGSVAPLVDPEATREMERP